MVMPKGGRGHKAPYETCTVRIPTAVRDLVEAIAEEYRLSALEGREFIPADSSPQFEEALAKAKKVAAQKQSGRKSIVNLLQLLYNRKVSEKDLD